MCIENPKKTFNRKPRKAYKVVKKYNNEIFSSYRDYLFKPRAWNIAPTPDFPNFNDEGFHVFTTLDGAINDCCYRETIYEILVDDIKYKGFFSGSPCLIVGKFKFIKQLQ